MFWKCTRHDLPGELDAAQVDGRYVVHRHVDEFGAHFDLRLERDGYLVGWRIDGIELGDAAMVTEKAPHHSRWLDHREGLVETGRYAVEHQSAAERVLLLESEQGLRRFRLAIDDRLAPASVRQWVDALAQSEAELDDAAALINDGATARSRAVERLCGLGRELDGAAFNADLWRRTLRSLTLDEIHAQLRSFEKRFDDKYPPQRLSKPECLDDDTRAGAALEIART